MSMSIHLGVGCMKSNSTSHERLLFNEQEVIQNFPPFRITGNWRYAKK